MEHINPLHYKYLYVIKTIDWKELSRHRKAYRMHLWSGNWVWRCDKQYWKDKNDELIWKISRKLKPSIWKVSCLCSLASMTEWDIIKPKELHPSVEKTLKNEFLLVIVKNNIFCVASAQYNPSFKFFLLFSSPVVRLAINCQ